VTEHLRLAVNRPLSLTRIRRQAITHRQDAPRRGECSIKRRISEVRSAGARGEPGAGSPGGARGRRTAGVACAAADIVDAIVIATAARRQAPIVTSDPDDLTHLCEAIGTKIRLYPI
jgi:hypothetical protein